MFARVAPRYDLLNHLLSFQVDRYWRRFTVARLAPVLGRDGVQVLDLCCGTGDLLVALHRVHQRPVFGVDFCHPMLEAARGKLGAAGLLVEADALTLPLPDAAFDVITIAFGLRNLANYRAGLVEMRRLLRPGGRLAVLEFSQPQGLVVGPVYKLYFKYVLPRVGGAISGSGQAYRYLHDSVDKFLSPEELTDHMQSAGFERVRHWSLTGGIAVLHVAET
jgi:demethylmenaquinone methyltransferase/2-methoxy-6-polyprenyl-1,4-benzoquinol methylase